MHCFNTGGTDWLGRTFAKTVNVAKGRVQPLWIGVQVPKDAAPGAYQGSVTIGANDVPDSTVQVSLTVTDKVLDDAGDGDLWRHARLRWLDSKIGLDDEVFRALHARGDCRPDGERLGPPRRMSPPAGCSTASRARSAIRWTTLPRRRGKYWPGR